MSDPLRTYTFLPWLRQGLGGRIATEDPLGPNPGGDERASVNISFQVDGQGVTNTVNLIGPGDVTGINPRAVVKTEPGGWITNFEPNYLPFVEFYDEDFPWRYTPAHARSDHRLRPWLVLVALSEDEFEDAGIIAPEDPSGGPPRPLIKITGQTNHIFPPFDQTWAWAHVHAAEDVSADGTRSVRNTITALENLVRRNPDQASSRLLCPRKLRPNTGYWGVLLPAFEIGRLAGLSQSTAEQDGLAPSWGQGQQEYPVYHKWYFRTSERGDFEYLVGLLEPRPIADEVGIRDMDMQRPGFGVAPLVDPRVMGLEGALRKPAAVPRPDAWPVTPSPAFLTTLVDKVNLGATQLEPPSGAAHPDPVVTLPLYGRWHAMVQRLDPDGSGWVDELNADPRLRTASGFGTRVMRTGQEGFMRRAWEQVRDVIAVNRRIRQAQLAIPASHQIFQQNLAALSGDQLLALSAPVHQRILGSSTTIRQKVTQSRLPDAALTAPFRAITRPRGRLMRQALPEANARPSNLLFQLNEGTVTAAEPKQAPAGQIGLDELSAGLIPAWVPSWISWLLRRPWLVWLMVLVLLVLAALSGSAWFSGVAAVLGAAMATLLLRLRRFVNAADSMSEAGITPDTVAAAPQNPDFAVTPAGQPLPADTGATGPDSDEGSRFRVAAAELAERLRIKAPVPSEPEPLDITDAVVKISATLTPKRAITQRLGSFMNVARSFTPLKPVETLLEVMAHPTFADPMYRPLRDLSPDLLVPNLNKIPNNTVSLMENNRRFIESYMVGLNHEMGRELLWREYPTDQRGSYFRQFWDVADTLPADPSGTAADIEESLRDITPLHTWGKASLLGTHANREIPTGAEPGETRLVLVLRGDLLKKYPTTVVYAQQARWGVPDDPSDPATLADREVRLLDESGADGSLLTPLFKAEIDPDIHFFGFDLTASVAKGSKVRDDNDPGWFFVLQERPGEPRFGLDVVPDGVLPSVTDWNKLAWDHLGDVDSLHTIDLDNVPATNIPAANPDRAINWGSNSADMAYILYQDPAMVAFHAGDMLE